MKGFAGSQDLRPKPRHDINNNNETGNLSEIRRQPITKDSKHIPNWDMKIQMGFEAKNPGPPKHKQRKARQRIEIITISDDEPDEELEKWEMIGRWTSGTNW